MPVILMPVSSGFLVTAGFVVLALGAIYLVVKVTVMVLEGLGSTFDQIWNGKQRQKRVTALIDQHVSALASRRQALVTTDAYALVSNTAWLQERSYFLATQILPLFAWARTRIEIEELGRRVDEAIDRHSRRPTGRAATLEVPQTGFDYEKACAHGFALNGWRAELTRKGADEGADLILSSGSRRVAVQCGFYNGNVGNAGVQEVVGAMAIYGANEALVVTNLGFTETARQVAKSNGVRLLLDTEIGSFQP